MAIAIIMKDNYTSVLTCSQASIGRQHAVLVTRGGELFTWGSGHGGKLGLGHMMDAHTRLSACTPCGARASSMWQLEVGLLAAHFLRCHAMSLFSSSHGSVNRASRRDKASYGYRSYFLI